MWRRIITNGDLVLCVLLCAIGLGLVKGLSHIKGDDAVVIATLAGALFAGAAVLLGNWINRLNEWQHRDREERRAAEELERRQAQLKMLITAELVNVAAGLVGANEILEAAHETVESTKGMVPLDMTSYLPRPMPFTDSLQSDLWLLKPSAIDALVTLRSNLAITRTEMEIVTAQAVGAWLHQVTSLVNGLRHTIDVLAQCFELIAPTRKLEFPGQPLEPASVLLKRISRGEKLRIRRSGD